MEERQCKKVMVEQIHIMVNCPYIGCPRSIGYCFKCDHKKGIINYDLICGYREVIMI